MPETRETTHQPFEGLQEFASRAEHVLMRSLLFRVEQVACEGEVKAAQVSERPISLTKVGHDNHELVEVEEVGHGRDEQSANVTADLLHTNVGAVVIQDVLVAHVVVELASRHGAIVQDEERPYLRGVEHTVPVPAHL